MPTKQEPPLTRNPNQILSAEEAADQIAQRYREKVKSRMDPNADSENDRGDPGYSCENCGHNKFIVTYSYDTHEPMKEVLPCTCGEEEYAAVLETLIVYEHSYSGYLDDEHRPAWEDKERDEAYRESEPTEVHCAVCFDQSDDSDWNIIEEDEESEEELNPKWAIHCMACRHEIEFGWSHPDRGGRLWPCECADFNPFMSWPEARFVDNWKSRGWLRN